jgi:hypothetical protein
MLAGDLHTALALVTQRVYGLGLGPRHIEYNCENFGRSSYTYFDLGGFGFHCSAFLERLAGQPGRGRYVNCSDCAAILVTFANVLGADLRTRRMHDPGWPIPGAPEDRRLAFELNPNIAIGSDIWDRACGRGNFNYHEVAWRGSGTQDERVYDACVMVDMDDDPTSAPHTARSPINLPFDEYRRRLAAPGPRGYDRCVLESEPCEVHIQ